MRVFAVARHTPIVYSVRHLRNYVVTCRGWYTGNPKINLFCGVKVVLFILTFYFKGALSAKIVNFCYP